VCWGQQLPQAPSPQSAPSPGSRQKTATSGQNGRSSSSAQRAQTAQSQNSGTTFKATLDSNESLFTVIAALNACGYDQELNSSDPLRTKIRGEVEERVAASAEARQAREAFCRFREDHKQGDTAHDVAQYVSLALFLSGPPSFAPAIAESDLPPDASYVLGAVPLLKNFYSAANIGEIWRGHRADYDAMVERFHDPVAAMIFRTDLYLKLQLSGYLGRRFIVYLEPLGAPGQINARNYGDDYYLVISPNADRIPMEALRHTYLHYVLDPYALKHGTMMKRLEPILREVSTAPMDESFKRDVSLLVTESLIRAVEARMISGKGRAADLERDNAVEKATKEGFVLTRYFYGALQKFEQGPTGLKDAYSDWIYQIDVGHERKQAEETEFSKQATPELVRASNPQQQADALDMAEQKLIAHDTQGAMDSAKQALRDGGADPARAMFILARASAESGDMPGAETYFQRTLDLAREPRLVAWSHIYLGRIMDLKEQRDAAVAQYRAALAAGDPTPDTKSAAERGLAQPYAAPHKQQQQPQ